MDAFLFAGDDCLLLSAEESDFSSAPSLDFLGILSNLVLLDGEDDTFEWLDFSLSLFSRFLSLELLLLPLLLDDFDEDECL